MSPRPEVQQLAVDPTIRKPIGKVLRDIQQLMSIIVKYVGLPRSPLARLMSAERFDLRFDLRTSPKQNVDARADPEYRRPVQVTSHPITSVATEVSFDRQDSFILPS